MHALRQYRYHSARSASVPKRPIPPAAAQIFDGFCRRKSGDILPRPCHRGLPPRIRAKTPRARIRLPEKYSADRPEVARCTGSNDHRFFTTTDGDEDRNGAVPATSATGAHELAKRAVRGHSARVTGACDCTTEVTTASPGAACTGCAGGQGPASPLPEGPVGAARPCARARIRGMVRAVRRGLGTGRSRGFKARQTPPDEALPAPGGNRTVVDTGRRHIRGKRQGACSTVAPILPPSGIRGFPAIGISQHPGPPQRRGA